MMDLTTKATFMLSVIVGALAVGYAARKTGLVPGRWSNPITRNTMTFLQPVMLGLMIWGLQPPGWQTSLLPFISAALMLAVWPIGWLLARMLGLENRQRGAFILSCMFSNMGLTYGAFMCYVLLGEQGAALGLIWCLAFSPMLFTVGLLIGRHHGREGSEPMRSMIRDTFAEPQTRNVLVGFAVGLALFWFKVPRPEWAGPAVEAFIPISTGLYLFAIGLSLSLGSLVRYWRECVAIGAVKFLITPAIAMSIAWAVGLWGAVDHTLLKVVLIQSASPAAIMGLIVAQLFDLDRDLANAGWLTTNMAAIALAWALLHIAAGL